MKRRIMLAAIFILFFTAGFIGYNLWSTMQYLRNEVSVAEIDLTNLEDGVYIGEFNAGILSAVVRVRVENHLITGIEILKHNNGLGKPAEAIINRVMDKQTLKVDMVAGATLSSKLILKALENGLR